MLTATSLQRVFTQFPDVSRYIVAFSGGLDSTVLLHAMQALNLPVHAVHINHHLQQESDQWQLHCQTICNAWNVEFSVQHVQIQKPPHKNVEESARNARYKLLHECMTAKDVLVTAHHQNDLAETLLLQLLRGAGPAGLAAMATEQNLIVGKHLRPLLSYRRAEIHEYAQRYRLRWVEDTSNDSLDFDRNYMRKKIMPALMARWPAALQTLTRAVTLQADARECLRELASLDLQAATTENSQILKAPALRQLSPPRLNNALRIWIQKHAMRVPNKRILEHIVTDIVRREDTKTSPLQTWKEGEVRGYRDRIYLMWPLTSHDPSQQYRWKTCQPLRIKSLNRTLSAADLIRHDIILPAGTRELTVRFRCGGERLKPLGEKHHRSLKNFFQDAGIPPWERNRIPLLYLDDRLIAVVGYWHGG